MIIEYDIDVVRGIGSLVMGFVGEESAGASRTLLRHLARHSDDVATRSCLEDQVPKVHLYSYKPHGFIMKLLPLSFTITVTLMTLSYVLGCWP